MNKIEKIKLKSQLKAQIFMLKKRLDDNDYKRHKNIEFAEVGKPLPYSWEDIHAESQPIRDKINELQAQLAEVMNIE